MSADPLVRGGSHAPARGRSDPRALVVVLPLPHRDLSPNARVHWRRKAVVVRGYRLRAHIEGCAAMIGAKQGPYPWGAAEVEARFYRKDRRRVDRDNLLASLKSAFDGLADAGLVADDADLTHLPVVVDVDRARPRVELHVRAA